MKEKVRVWMKKKVSLDVMPAVQLCESENYNCCTACANQVISECCVQISEINIFDYQNISYDNQQCKIEPCDENRLGE